MALEQAMRFECNHCQQLSEFSLQVGAAKGSVEFICAGCGERSACQMLESNAGVDSPADEAGERCPKCYSVVGVDSCPSCGLVRSKFSEFAQDKGAGLSNSLQKEWDSLESEWEDEHKHTQFVQAAFSSNESKAAAILYREQLGNSKKKEQAERMLEKIRLMATSTLLSSAKPEKESEPYKSVLLLLFGLVAIAIVGAIYFLNQPPPAQSKSPAPRKAPSFRSPNSFSNKKPTSVHRFRPASSKRKPRQAPQAVPKSEGNSSSR